ncbi:hypothetical protein OAT67_05480 [Bacteriovoracaceae bacterium]|nr:hypothetical protein [Bacteriovoracaceae bacterium]
MNHRNIEALANRKTDHLNLAQKSQLDVATQDKRFFYEPLFSAHPSINDDQLRTSFLGKQMKAPIWVSSMTGGSGEAGPINKILAKICSEYGLGFGLGSCRSLLDSDEFFEDFNLRSTLGDLPFLANIGIAQLEQLVRENKTQKLDDLVDRLQADGLIIHVNPLQEYFQPEGDRFTLAPLETITKFLEVTKSKIVVKEVGQGMGPKSLEALMSLPISAIEFGAYGGTNFSYLEQQRDVTSGNNEGLGLATVGHTCDEMVVMLNRIIAQKENVKEHIPEIIISGGVKSFLDGYYLMQKCDAQSVYGQAKGFLEHAFKGEDALRAYVENQILGLKMAYSYLKIRD